jgi:hypothetical protein
LRSAEDGALPMVFGAAVTPQREFPQFPYRQLKEGYCNNYDCISQIEYLGNIP